MDTTVAQIQWALHRTATVTAGPAVDTDLAPGTKKWASVIATYSFDDNVPVAEGLFKLSKRHNNAIIRFRSNGDDDDTFTYKVYMFKKGDDAVLAATGDVNLGVMQATNQLGSATTYYGQDISVTSSFVTTCRTSIAPAGADEMAILVVPTGGFEYMLVLITATGELDVTEQVAVDVSGY